MEVDPATKFDGPLEEQKLELEKPLEQLESLFMPRMVLCDLGH